jgi:hypothetical protein
MIENGDINIDLDDMIIYTYIISDMNILVGIAEIDIIMKIMDSSIDIMEDIVEVEDWRDSEDDWLIMDIDKIDTGIDIVFYEEIDRDRIGVRNIESYRDDFK